ncbi:MAG: TlyA family rRNA (cytidine-2'-O)-methyltransferase [Acidimicrobiia bacterium]
MTVVRRRLDVELVRRGLAESRTTAARLIGAGRVRVAGLPATTSARRVDGAAPITVVADGPQYVSRGGVKLAAALDAFGLDVGGQVALDAGASTGGFTDCLLQRGAARVHAVDVGRGQLAWKLRQDPRVIVRERTYVRTLDRASLGVPVGLVVADLSFISLVTVAPALVACAVDAADFVLLVKPQFEAGRDRVGRGGIVREPAVHAAVLGEVSDGLAAAGLLVTGIVASPIRGADGNREFLVRADRRGPVVDHTVLAAAAGSDTG